MSERTITIEHEGTTYYGIVGTIESTMLGYEDHGILTAYLSVEWPGGGVSVGGYALDSSGPADMDARKRVGTGYGLDHIIALMSAAGVSSWEALVGKKVIVLFKRETSWGDRAVGIAHITDVSKVLILEEHSKEWRKRESQEKDARPLESVSKDWLDDEVATVARALMADGKQPSSAVMTMAHKAVGVVLDDLGVKHP